jgi:hypothetical protein
MPDGNTTVILQGKRFEIESVTSEDPYLTVLKIFLKIDLNKQTLNF